MLGNSVETGGSRTMGDYGVVGYAHVGMLVAALMMAASVATASERMRFVLADHWHIRPLDTDTPDVAALTREATQPDGRWYSTSLPAQVHDVLLRHGRIPDPRISKNAAESAWVGEKDWVYACSFPTPNSVGGTVFLRFDGLDTLVAAYLNTQPIGTFNNMYRKHAVNVAEALAPPGNENVLLLVFSAPLRFVDQVEKPKHLEGVVAAHFLRKCHSDFGSYLGARPHSAKVGIFRDVSIDIPGQSWIEDVWVRSHLAEDFGTARVRIQVETAGSQTSVHWQLTDPEGTEIAQGDGTTSQNRFGTELEIDAPKLWWPRTHGTPHLYELSVTLLRDNDRLDSHKTRFGIRQIRPVLVDPKTREKRFRFDINGRPIFLRGADLAPIEGMTHCWNDDKALRLLDLMEHGRMNVLRIWAEGNIPPQSFYDECDRRGILIWQDFMFGFGMHPSGEEDFDENCRLEIEGMIRGLRNHPSIMLWCGGNENHMGWDFRYGTKPTAGNGLFDKVMPEAVARLDPDRLFHPSSPYGGRVPNWPLEGDWHDYSTLKFCPNASVPLYASEVGRASAPSITSMRRFLSDEELWPDGHDPAIDTPGKAAWPPMWQYRSVGGSWDKVGPLEQYCDPKSAEDLVRVLGTAHGDYLRERVERQRRGVPDGAPDGNRRCWGNMVWRLNDSWPIIYWAVIDYYIEPKIPFYYLRRAYDPILVTFERTADEIFVWIVNDSPDPVKGTLTVKRRTFNGDTRGEVSNKVALGPGEAKRCLSVTELGPVVMRKEFLQAEFADRKATQLLIGERYLHLPDAGLNAQVVDGKIEITTRAFARQVTLTADGVTGAVFEDNFFDMPPQTKRTITVLSLAGAERVWVTALNGEPIQLKFRGR